MIYNIGDTVRFDVSWDYQGPSYNGGKLRCVVGLGGTWLGFDERCWTELSLYMLETLSWERFSQRVLVTLKNVQLGEIYDTYVKLAPNVWGEENLYWHGAKLISMGAAYPDSEFRNLSVVIG